MRRTINNVISVIFSFIRLLVLRLFHHKGIYFGLIERISPNVVIEVNRGGKIIFGEKVRIHSGCKLKSRGGSILEIGSNVRINYNCMLICHKKIHIGSGTEFGPNVLVYDHDHDYKAGLKNDKFVTGDVAIGENCWIGANTVILKGSVIGDNCVVAAGSVISGVYPANSLIYYSREIKTKIYDGLQKERIMRNNHS